jgi:hypothetical protein
VNAAGDYIVSDYSNTAAEGLVVEINPSTGTQTAITPSPVPYYFGAITLAASGTIYLTASDTNQVGYVLAINPTSGATSVLASFGSGNVGLDVKVMPDGQLLVPTETVGTGMPNFDEIDEVDPNSGSVIVVTSGGDLVDAIAAIPESNGNILVLNELADATPYAVVEVVPRPDANVISGNTGDGGWPGRSCLDDA